MSQKSQKMKGSKSQSSQRKWQLINLANGMCQNHKDRPIADGSSTFCTECMQKSLSTTRRRNTATLKDKLESGNGCYVTSGQMKEIAQLIGARKLRNL